MFVGPLLGAIEGAEEPVDHIRMLFNKLGAGDVGGIGKLSAVDTEGGDDVPLSLLFQHGSGRFEQLGKIPGSRGKSPSQVFVVDILDDLHVLMGSQTVFALDVFAHHLGHSALSLAEQGFAAQIAPAKVIDRFPRHQEGAVRLGHLAEGCDGTGRAAGIDINPRLQADQNNIRIPGQEGGHRFIPAEAVGQLDIQPFLLKNPLDRATYWGA